MSEKLENKHGGSVRVQPLVIRNCISCNFNNIEIIFNKEMIDSFGDSNEINYKCNHCGLEFTGIVRFNSV